MINSVYLEGSQESHLLVIADESQFFLNKIRIELGTTIRFPIRSSRLKALLRMIQAS